MQSRANSRLSNLLELECCYCGEWGAFGSTPLDLHEIIITRGDAQFGSEALKLAIHDRRNCGWIHHLRCHGMANGEDGFAKGIDYLLRYEGRTALFHFLDQASALGFHRADEYKRRIDNIWTYLVERDFYGRQELYRAD